MNFSFTSSSGRVVAPLSLVQGNNVVVLKGTNNDGTDEKSVNIIYRPSQTVEPPRVTIYEPARSPYNTNNPATKVGASVEYVASRSGSL